MGEQYESKLTQPQTPEPADPNADVDTLSLEALRDLQRSLERQLIDAERTEPSWAIELAERLKRVEERLQKHTPQ